MSPRVRDLTTHLQLLTRPPPNPNEQLLKNKGLARRFAMALQQIGQRCLTDITRCAWMDLWQ
jgi:hypothetical protein